MARPHRTDIDHNAVAVSIALIGVRPTARKFNLPVGTVYEIAKRGEVTVPPQKPYTPSVAVRIPDAPLCQQPPHVIATELMTAKAGESKLSTAIWGATATAHAATLEGEAALAAAQGMQSTTRALANARLPGWEQGDQPGQLHLHLHRGTGPDDIKEAQVTTRGTIDA